MQLTDVYYRNKLLSHENLLIIIGMQYAWDNLGCIRQRELIIMYAHSIIVFAIVLHYYEMTWAVASVLCSYVLCINPILCHKSISQADWKYFLGRSIHILYFYWYNHAVARLWWRQSAQIGNGTERNFIFIFSAMNHLTTNFLCRTWLIWFGDWLENLKVKSFESLWCNLKVIEWIFIDRKLKLNPKS